MASPQSSEFVALIKALLSLHPSAFSESHLCASAVQSLSSRIMSFSQDPTVSSKPTTAVLALSLARSSAIMLTLTLLDPRIHIRVTSVKVAGIFSPLIQSCINLDVVV